MAYLDVVFMIALNDSKAWRVSMESTEFDAIVIGAGIAGIYQVYKLRELGLRVRAFEAGGGVGGTWYWNRYPGARFDSESYSYAYSFSEELLAEWNWSEHFAGQPEANRYLNYVVDKFNLREDIQLDSRVTAARYDDDARAWTVTLEDSRKYTARFVITAIGNLSTPQLPRIEGLDSFQGPAFHTARWPSEPVDFTSKRVAVIGTGATGVQVIQTIASQVGHLTVFQRTADWVAPLNNRPITAEEQPALKASYPQVFARCRETSGGFMHTPDPRGTFDVSDAEREAFHEQLYSEPGMGIWLGNFRDMGTDERANTAVSEFVAKKIRQRIKDPLLAEKLIPKDHGFATRRVPMDQGYYEVYSQDNVELVDTRETAITRIVPTGIETVEKLREFDIIIYATGFDAFTGSFDKIDFRARGGQALKDKWEDGPRTFLGIFIEDFPNLMMVMGPHSKIGNYPRTIEFDVEWVSELIDYARENGVTRIEPSYEAVAAWGKEVLEASEGLLSDKVDSWLSGYNPNLDTRQRRSVLRYNGPLATFRERCAKVAANGYQELNVS
jgi:cation diffusion facilitator CzcD-associated flavoprotein CzcO